VQSILSLITDYQTGDLTNAADYAANLKRENMSKINDCTIDSASIVATIDAALSEIIDELKWFKREMEKQTEVLGEISTIIEEVSRGA